jgi:hypothetical protein
LTRGFIADRGSIHAVQVAEELLENLVELVTMRGSAPGADRKSIAALRRKMRFPEKPLVRSPDSKLRCCRSQSTKAMEGYAAPTPESVVVSLVRLRTPIRATQKARRSPTGEGHRYEGRLPANDLLAVLKFEDGTEHR